MCGGDCGEGGGVCVIVGSREVALFGGYNHRKNIYIMIE